MTNTDFTNQIPVPADAAVSRRRLAKIAVTALAVAGLGAAGLSGALARHGDGVDDDFVSSPSGGSGWDDDVFAGSGGSGGSGWDDDDWVFGSGGSGGSGDSGWDD